MNYRIWILEELIEKYESRKAPEAGGRRQRIALRMEKERAVAQRMESAEEKERFLEALDQLKTQGLIDYSWVKFEKGNLVERIWLIEEAESLAECFRLLGRAPKERRLAALKAMLIRCAGQMKSREELYDFLQEMAQLIEEKRRLPRFFSFDERLNEEILLCLACLADNREEIQERVFSVRLLGDSKAFEKRVKARLVSILRYVTPEKEEKPSDEELLRARGLVKWPEILEFTGDIKIVLRNGRRVDYGGLEQGAYINSQTVLETEGIDLEGINRVMFIENKANYIWYITHEKKADELALFHGGCYSPVKGTWFQKLRTAGDQRTAGREPISYYHWSDIDAGGFRIFTRLQGNIVPELQPYRMDCQTLKKYRDKGISLGGKAYRQLLEKMAEEERYGIFKEVIQAMLEWDMRLEQENLI